MPYIAFYVPGDQPEIDRQVKALGDLAAKDGRVGWRDLPSPKVPRQQEAWRSTLIAHGEFLGWGWCPSSRELVTW